MNTALIAMLFAFDCAKQNAGCDAYPAVELALRI